MARTCFMCGRDIPAGAILCAVCDKPKKAKKSAAEESGPPKTSQALALDPFPAAPVVPFPVESASPAITSVVNLLVAAGVPAFFLGADRSVKFVSDAALKLFDATQGELSMLAGIEERSGVRVGELAVPVTSGARVRDRNVLYSLIPMSGGASGAVIIFRETDPMNEAHASFVSFVRETALEPLRSLRDALRSAQRHQISEALLSDAAGTLDQILSSLELAPGVGAGAASAAKPVPRAIDVVRRVAERFSAAAALKGVELQVDVQELEERFEHHEQLADALAILVENALHYVPPAGMVVIGVRWMEHKSKPILLFFVMDNGPLVPESMRQAIFEPSFSWNPAGERTGRALFRCREFAATHGGSVWVESKTGKACTFFLRVRPDSAT
ncbi:MAG TPA: HAMP domain-containing sensor histidine kinase [Thermoanaerobaculia bacterium]|nr:HAMP domain-containing sensor histidine kinase [Thermoanaerobaculia bacterium]